MGFLSSVWKGVKNVFKGVMKVFTPILAPLAKAMDTGWGKALMIALSIFTMGTAFVAAQAVYAASMAAGQSMLSAFVAGGVEFVKVFLGAEASELGAGAAAAGTAAGSTGAAGTAAAEMGTAAGALEGAAGVAAGNVGAASELVAGAGSGALEGAGAASSAMQGGGKVAKAAGTAMPGPTKELAKAGGQLATRVPPGAEGNWLSKAAKSAWDFASKDDFKNTKDLISGYSEIEEREDIQKHQDRYARRWRDPGSKGMQAFDSALEDRDEPRFSPGGPGKTLDRNRRGFNPTIPFRGEPQGAGG